MTTIDQNHCLQMKHVIANLHKILFFLITPVAQAFVALVTLIGLITAIISGGELPQWILQFW